MRPEIAAGGATGDFAVTVANEGNVPLAVTLTGDDPENRVDFAFEPRQLRLPPGRRRTRGCWSTPTGR